MESILVNASKKYSVVIANGLLDQLSKHLSKIANCCKIAVITDKNVDNIYSKKVIKELSTHGYDVYKYVVKGGEESKSSVEFVNILEFLALNGFTRSDILVALGGGVVGDLTGFVASAYLRGIKFVQVPTTLLAFCDSSVGGKTAINLNAGKNLVGAFYQPSLVVCDVDTLKTLPPVEYACGMAEVIKYGMIFDSELLQKLADGNGGYDEKIIAKCVDLKRIVVEKDERDNGDRQLLNFGHTLAHAIEKKSNFNIPHGIAVGMGMKIITERAILKGLCDKTVGDVLDRLLSKYNLPGKCEYTLAELFDITLIDKKRKGDGITLVIPKTIGKCELLRLTINEWKEFLLG